MQNLPNWLPWVVIGFALFSGIGLVWYLFFGGEDDEEETQDTLGIDPLSTTAAEGGFHDTLATTTEELKTTARESRIIALKQSLERSLDSREARAHTSAKDRMSMPWFMLVGADGSGKKTILGNTGLPLPWGPPLEVDSHRKDAGKWWLFEDAVVLEAPAAAPGPTAIGATLPPDQTVADTSVGWNTLLHMLRRDRPDSPLNGIIITISCLDLLNARNNPERMEDQADRINNFLTRTRNFLGVRLPIHVLVTKCDTLPGFRGFAAALPASRRHDIFGWANPNDPEKPFDPSWIDSGFTRLLGQLSDLRDEALAAPEIVEDSTGVFVFDNEFADLQDSLKAFIARIIPIDERRPSLFFRGFYFTGDALEGTPPKDAGATISESNQQPSTRLSTEVAAEPHDLVFLRELFATKIFKEAGLARPMGRWRLSRDRRVVLAQAASLLIALVGSGGLWMAINGWQRGGQVYQAGLKSDAAVLTRVLSGVAIDLDEVRFGNGPASPLDRRARDAAVIELVAQMRDVPTGGVRSPFIPTSWFSSLPNDIEQSMLAGLQSIVLPVTRQRLEERTSRLLGTAAPPTAAGVADGTVTQSGEEADAFDPRALAAYLQDVRVLSRNIERYNSLADSSTGNVAELSALLDYLFGEQISADSMLATTDFEAALRRASAPRIAATPTMASTVVNRAVAMISSVGEDAARQLAVAPTAAAERAIKPADDLRALNGLASLVKLLDAKDGLVATVSDSLILGTHLARTVEDSITARFKRAAWRIVGDTVAPDSAAARLRAAIERLYQYRLMEHSDGGRQIVSDIQPNQRLRWDVGRLELALALPAEYLQAVVTISNALPGRNPDRLHRALGVQLRERSLDVVASAQRFTPLGPKADTLMEVRTSGLNLDAAAPRLARLSQSFDTLRAAREGRMLMRAGARQAEQALAMAQRIFESWNFAPQTARVATWQGVQPLSFAALGVTTDTLEQVSKMLQYTTDLRSLTAYVAPAIRYLRTTAADSLRVPALLPRWEAITVASQKEARGDASSTLGMLMYFVRETMSMRDLASCTARASEPDSIKASGDVFVIKRRQFRAAMVSRCGTGGASDAVAGYQRLRSLFQSRLAGRYPFADSTHSARGSAEADAASVREFFRQFDAFRTVDDIALRSHPMLSQTAKSAIAFIDQLAAVRRFIAPFVDSGSVRTVPAYSILATMSISPDTLPNYLLDLDIGGRQAAVDESALEHTWRAGDSVRVILSPLDTSPTRTLYAAGGNWAAVRFLRAAPQGMTVRVYHPDTKLELSVPEFPVVAPEIFIPRSR